MVMRPTSFPSAFFCGPIRDHLRLIEERCPSDRTAEHGRTGAPVIIAQFHSPKPNIFQSAFICVPIRDHLRLMAAHA